jgi:hypothetical protein
LSGDERVRILQDFLETQVMGIELVWYVVAIAVVCTIFMVLIMADGYRSQHILREKAEHDRDR